MKPSGERVEIITIDDSSSDEDFCIIPAPSTKHGDCCCVVVVAEGESVKGCTGMSVRLRVRVTVEQR